MLAKELTDRRLLLWAIEELDQKIGCLAQIIADRAAFGNCDDRSLEVSRQRGFQVEVLRQLRNNLRLGTRIIDGEIPELGDRPWTEADAEHIGSERTPVVGYVAPPREPIPGNSENCVKRLIRLRTDLERQQQWVDMHGGDVAGYIRRYGDPGIAPIDPATNEPKTLCIPDEHRDIASDLMPVEHRPGYYYAPMFGWGGTAIYKADSDKLDALRSEVNHLEERFGYLARQWH